MHTNSPAHQPAVLCMRSLLSFVFIEPFQIWCDLTSWSLHFSVYNCSPGFNYSIVNARSGVHIHTHNTLYLCQNYPHFPPLLNCKTMSLHQCTSAANNPVPCSGIPATFTWNRTCRNFCLPTCCQTNTVECTYARMRA